MKIFSNRTKTLSCSDRIKAAEIWSFKGAMFQSHDQSVYLKIESSLAEFFSIWFLEQEIRLTFFPFEQVGQELVAQHLPDALFDWKTKYLKLS